MGQATHSQRPSCLVVGGAGFLGRHLVDALVDSFNVSTFDVRESGDPSVVAIVGDIRQLQHVVDACKGMEVVFHCASVAPSAEDATDMALAYAVNVVGTQNVINACIRQGVPKLVFTSSASVVYEGQDLNSVDETAPYARKPLDYYTQTKIEAEKLVLAANGVHGLATVAVRPSGIFGEWDRLTVPTIIDKAKQGKIKYIIGSGTNMMEFTYASNVADAHVLAAQKLSLKSPVAGQAYFVTNDEPLPIWTFMGDITEAFGYGRPSIKLPWQPLFLIALFMEWVVQPLLRPLIKLKQSDFTSSRIRIVSSNRVLNISRAKQELGYRPRVTLKEGLKRTVAHFKGLNTGMECKKVQ